jgi:peptide/nickel transport system ATP-binding protein
VNAALRLQQLAVAGLSVQADATTIVENASFRLSQGQPVTLLGESGSGKSLVAHAIMGSLPRGLSASGSVRLDGTELLSGNAEEVRARWGRTIALLPQEPWLALDPTMRIGEQVAEVHRYLRGVGVHESRTRAEADLREVGLGNRASAYPFELSGGMCQRGAIAITHATDAPVLIADEPTKGLGADLRDSVVARLRREVDQGRLLLTITHDIAVARQLGGMIGVMLDGRLIEVGQAEDILANPKHAYTRALIDADPARWTAPDLASTGEIVIEGRGLAKVFDGRTLFENLDLAVRRGEIVAIVGPSGCGKTTIGNLLLGLVPPERGSVHRNDSLSTLRFQKLYQDPPAAFAPRQTLRRGLRDLLRLHRFDWRAVHDLMMRLRLAPALLDRRPNEVSGGELQRFAILRALMLDPVFLFADEATSRLDPISQKDVIELLVGIVRDRGLGLLIVTHDLALAERIASRVVRLG